MGHRSDRHAVRTIDVRPADSRFGTRIDWLDSHHSFSFGSHYDPANVGHGLLLVNNDDIVRAGSGFSTHPHRDMEIVTWVLSGELEHKDSEGNTGLLYPGLAQRMSAGTGIWHSEMNPSRGSDVHFIQMWVLPDTERVNPGYEQLDVNAQLAGGDLVPIASGKGHEAAISIRQRDAVLWGARLAPGAKIAVPDGRHVHVYVPAGSAELFVENHGDDEAQAEPVGYRLLHAGDAVRLTTAGARPLTAGEDGAEVLIWVTG